MADRVADWEAMAERLGEPVAEAGGEAFLRRVGDRHLAQFVPGGGRLLVTFEDGAAVERRASGRPWARQLAAKRGYATLAVVSDGRTWFRDRALATFFDELTDDGLFDEFDAATFAGTGPGAYAAAAYSVASPGATVFAVQPVATLERDLTPWEPRFRSARALDWGRYGYAPDMVEAAGRVWIVSDPRETFDAMHASLFRGPHVTHLRAPHAGSDVGARLESVGILDKLVSGAEAGALTPLRFAQLWRGRRRDMGWLMGMMRRLDRLDRPWLMGLFARHVTQRHDSAAARRRLTAARMRLAAAGRELPADRDQPEAARAAS